jgi:hypothetical protein
LIARCTCGQVEYEITGRPIVSLICFCDDCQAGAAQLDDGASIIDRNGGTAYVVARKDRFRCVRGEDLTKKHKLRPDSKTNRVVAKCCPSPMFMWFDDAKHWVPIYRARIANDAPDTEMQICTKFAKATPVDSDVPTYAGYPFALVTKLLRARVAMVFG